MDFILGLDNKENGAKKSFIDNVLALSKAHSMCITTKEGARLNEEISYFKAVKASILKLESENKGDKPPLTEKEVNKRIAKLMSKTILSEEVIDVYSVLGMNAPDISILSESFLEEVRKIKYKNLAIEMLRKLIEGKIHYSSRKNITLSEKFSERLKKVMNAYKNKALTNFEIFEELMKMAKEYKEAEQKGKDLGLTEDELAFYDAITKDEGIFTADGMSDEKLVKIVKDLADAIRKNITIDWYDKESVQAQMRSSIRRLLKKHGYPPENREDATDLVLEQAKKMCEDMEI